MYQAQQLLVVSPVMSAKPIRLPDLHDMCRLMLPLLQQVVTNKLLLDKAVDV